jgi:hypothetical protein
MRIQFQTNSFTPPPFAYAIEVELTETETGLDTGFQLTYLDRDQLDEEEILEEGFTLNDDFQWKGVLPAEWKAYLKELSEALALEDKTELEEQENFWQVTMDGKTGYPDDEMLLEQFLQELQQAAYEAAAYEAPLHITFLRIQEGQEIKHEFNASFLKREFTANGKSKKWSELQSFLNTVFGGEFRPDQALQKYPRKNALYVNMGDDFWYELGKSYLIQPSLIQKYLD